MANELITLEEVKEHCRIDQDFDFEDSLIKGYINAALEICQQHIGKRFDNGLEFNPAMKVGCLLLISHWYDNRGIVADKATEIPFATTSLWNYYRAPGVY
ncbi:phage gp6-like head-tail connector protein [Hafnia paralvei]|uniref:head-tail connector protein n=1 Tax=Hafnia paralvei TaxID=546367 RepID=UPI0010353D07|nr:head-tail connector protein [Hafnia paralvei]EJA4641087.1 phage gp6-like head-tail connector protein [Escherichia coli]TBM01153.1 phage gp6-like head-tail connector protein [Hafnia paralvei]TBM33412.1 phage gp6-like head-tail connector protein [Hafnia paralvei]